MSPDDAGLVAGLRRRTPGLRREELAQLAGIGVTWYTWLEQGRPITPSVQVLDSISRVLGLGPTERWHLYRLAEVPGLSSMNFDDCPPDPLVEVIDAFDPAPACVYNGKYDLLACNEAYSAMFPGIAAAKGSKRNALWQIYAAANNSAIDESQGCEYMIAVLRANYANHVGEPSWTSLIEALCEASEVFAAQWSMHPIRDPKPPQTRILNCTGKGDRQVRTFGFPIPGTIDNRMVVYVPAAA